MGMLAVRRLAELCYDRAVADGREGGSAAMRRFEQAITLPTGERYLVIVVTDLFFGPRVTLLVLLCWGAVASAYLLTGRMVGSALMTALLGTPGVPGPPMNLCGERKTASL